MRVPTGGRGNRMTVRYQIIGPPDQVREVRDYLESVFGNRIVADVDVTNRTRSLARWYGAIVQPDTQNLTPAVELGAGPISFGPDGFTVRA